MRLRLVRYGDIETYGNDGKGPVWWYPIEKIYDDANKPNELELKEMKKILLEELNKLV